MKVQWKLGLVALALAMPAYAQEVTKGGMDETGPYEVVRGWFKPGIDRWDQRVVSVVADTPDRIIIGEVRGPEALDLIKAWGTGHPGGVGTLHAGSALGALLRLEQLIQEVVVTVPRGLIAETIDVIAVLAGRGRQRRLIDLVRLEGLGPGGHYQLRPA